MTIENIRKPHCYSVCSTAFMDCPLPTMHIQEPLFCLSKMSFSYECSTTLRSSPFNPILIAVRKCVQAVSNEQTVTVTSIKRHDYCGQVRIKNLDWGEC